MVSQSRFSTPFWPFASTEIVKRSTAVGSVLTFMSIVKRSFAALWAVPHWPVSLLTMSFQPFAVGIVHSV